MKMRHHKRTKYGEAQWINAIHMGAFLFYKNAASRFGYDSRYDW